MKRKRRSVASLLLLLCSCSLLIVACGGHSHPSTRHSASKLNWKEGTPGMSGTLTPGATSTGTPTGNVIGEFVGTISNTPNPTWIALSSNGSRLVALISDGTTKHNATFAQWFKGSVQNNNVVASPVDNPTNSGNNATATPGTTPEATPGTTPGATPEATPSVGPEETPTETTPGGVTTVTPGANKGSNLMATLTSDSVSGTVILNDGRSFPFNAHLVSRNAVLYRGESTSNGTTYVGGWIVTPNKTTGPTATVTPGATATQPTETATPGATATLPSETVTPGATGTATGTPSMPSSTGVIINKQTGEIIQAPALTAQNIVSKQITVPNIGTFNLQRCQQGQC